jgi:L-fuconolactonase
MERLSKIPVVRGIRRITQYQPDPDYVLKPDFVAGVRLLPRYGLSCDLCIYHNQMPGIIKLVRQCPEVSFILDHIGKPGIRDGLIEPWKTHIRELASLPNVMCKLSGVTTEADHANWTREQLRPYIDHVITCFGIDRLMYGGDWPVAELAGTYTSWIEVLDWATQGLTHEERLKLFRDNGIRAYRL